MRNISIRIPEGALLWIDEQIKKVGRFGSRADVFREALTQLMNPTISLEVRKVVNVRKEKGILIETVGCQTMQDTHKEGNILVETIQNRPSLLLAVGDNLSIDMGPQLVVLDIIEPRKLLLKFYSGNAAKAKKAFSDAERKKQEWQDVK